MGRGIPPGSRKPSSRPRCDRVRSSHQREVLVSTAVASPTNIRSFTIDIQQERLDDLNRRLAATRWPTKELVADRSQGVQLATMEALSRYWTTEYDWRKAESRL